VVVIVHLWSDLPLLLAARRCAAGRRKQSWLYLEKEAQPSGCGIKPIETFSPRSRPTGQGWWAGLRQPSAAQR